MKIITLLAALAALLSTPLVAGKPEHLGNGPENFTVVLKNVAGYKRFKVAATYDFRHYRTVATFNGGESEVVVTDTGTRNRRYQFYVIQPVIGGGK